MFSILHSLPLSHPPYNAWEAAIDPVCDGRSGQLAIRVTQGFSKTGASTGLLARISTADFTDMEGHLTLHGQSILSRGQAAVEGVQVLVRAGSFIHDIDPATQPRISKPRPRPGFYITGKGGLSVPGFFVFVHSRIAQVTSSVGAFEIPRWAGHFSNWTRGRWCGTGKANLQRNILPSNIVTEMLVRRYGAPYAHLGQGHHQPHFRLDRDRGACGAPDSMSGCFSLTARALGGLFRGVRLIEHQRPFPVRAQARRVLRPDTGS